MKTAHSAALEAGSSRPLLPTGPRHCMPPTILQQASLPGHSHLPKPSQSTNRRQRRSRGNSWRAAYAIAVQAFQNFACHETRTTEPQQRYQGHTAHTQRRARYLNGCAVAPGQGLPVVITGSHHAWLRAVRFSGSSRRLRKQKLLQHRTSSRAAWWSMRKTARPPSA